MANIRAIDIDEQVVYLKAEGEGTELDPHVSVFTVDGDTVIKTEVTNQVLTVDTQLTQGLTNQQLLDANVDVTVTNLPDGAATATNQGSILGAVSKLLTDTELRAAPLGISAGSLPLPSGAATATNQTTLIGHVDGIESALAGTLTVNTGITQPLTDIQLRATDVKVSVTNLPATQPVSAANLPLPSGAATSANQTTIIGHVDGLEAAVAGLTPLTDTQLRAAPVPVSGTFYQGTQPISAVNLPLPSGAATSANQVTMIGHVDSIESALAGTITVDTGITQPLTDAQLRAANVNVSITNLPATQPVSAAALPLPNGAATSANQVTMIGHIDGVEGLIAGLTPLTDTQLRANPVAVTGTFYQATQPVSAVTLPLPAGASTAANQSTAITSLGQIKDAVTGTLTVSTGLTPLTDVQLRATPVATSVSSLPLPTGAATGANQQRIPGLDIPKHDTVVVTEDSAGKLSTVAYSLSGAPVATLGFTYSGYTFVEPYKTTTIVRS
jgi:hypothetical protein